MVVRNAFCYRKTTPPHAHACLSSWPRNFVPCEKTHTRWTLDAMRCVFYCCSDIYFSSVSGSYKHVLVFLWYRLPISAIPCTYSTHFKIYATYLLCICYFYLHITKRHKTTSRCLISCQLHGVWFFFFTIEKNKIIVAYKTFKNCFRVCFCGSIIGFYTTRDMLFI